MGDRANAYLVLPTSFGAKPNTGGIYLYTHYYGSIWPEMVREALIAAKGRWTDEHYATRILISELFKNEHGQSLGAGVGLIIGDNEHAIVVVDFVRQTVSFAEAGEESMISKRVASVSFEDYVAQEKASYPKELR